MASAIFRAANCLRRALEAGPRPPVPISLWPGASGGYCTAKRPSLASTVYPLGHPSISLAPELDRWAAKGNNVRPAELQMLVRDLRRRRRYKQALEVSEWMKSKGKVSFMPSDHAVLLDLIGRVRGLPSAETYFDNMHERDKTEKTYGALLNCYVRDGLIEKSLSHMQKMKEMGLTTSALCYNDIMCLYTNASQYEKVPSVLAEMKANGVLPDNFSYRICINSLGTQSDINGMEMILEEMEHQPQIVVDWNTYSVVANIYIKAGLTDKAISALKKAEGKLEKKNGLCYNHLISLYGLLGYKAEMWRIWELQKSNGNNFINRDYTTMLGALVKLGELAEAEVLLKEWETSGNAYDFRVPNILLVGYRQKGLLEKAEAMLDDFLKKGKIPPANSWGIVATGYTEKGEMAKAHEFMKNALCVYAPNHGWEPNPKVVKSILHWLGDKGDLDSVKMFVDLLQNAIPMDKDMYHSLIKANLRAGREVNELLKRMRDDGLEVVEETQEILGSGIKDSPA